MIPARSETTVIDARRLLAVVALLAMPFAGIVAAEVFAPFVADLLRQLGSFVPTLSLLMLIGGPAVLLLQAAGSDPVRRRRTLARNLVLVPLAVFAVVGILVNTQMARTGALSRGQELWLFIVVALPLLFMVLLNAPLTTEQIRYAAIGLIVIGLVVTVLLTFTDAQGSFPSLNGVIRSRWRAYLFGTPRGPVMLATLASLVIVAATLVWAYNRRNWLGLAALGAAAISLVGLLASGGRMGVIVTMVGLVLGQLLAFRGTLRDLVAQSLSVLLVVVLGVAAVVVLASLLDRTHIFERLASLPTAILSPQDDIGSRDRLLLWNVLIPLVINQPLGVGFSYSLTVYDLSPHNEYLNLALGTGVLGLIAFLVFVGIALVQLIDAHRRLRRQERRDALRLVVDLALVQSAVMLVAILTESSFVSNPYVTLLWWGELALALNAISQANLRPATAPPAPQVTMPPSTPQERVFNAAQRDQ